jgi:site-specific recombinase XerD
MSRKKSTRIAPWQVTEEMFLSERETEALLTFIRDREQKSGLETMVRAATDRMIIELLLFSGLRNSELCHLRVMDTAVGHGLPGVQVANTPSQDRMVFIPRSLSDLIVQYVAQIRPRLVAGESSATDVSQPLILNERGRPYDRTALYRRVVRILNEAGLEDRASVQLLRHTYGFLAYKRTYGNLLFVQRQMGHAHPMVTAVYSQFVPFSDPDLANLVFESGSVPKTMQAKHSAKPPSKKGVKR